MEGTPETASLYLLPVCVPSRPRYRVSSQSTLHLSIVQSHHRKGARTDTGIMLTLLRVQSDTSYDDRQHLAR